MQHVKPSGKGDPLCPLGFHPQVRWPTRCKRCFRDYKEHGNRFRESTDSLRRNDVTASTPALGYPAKLGEDGTCSIGNKSWISTNNLNVENHQQPKYHFNPSDTAKCSASWISTPNLAELSDSIKSSNADQIVSFTLPRRRSQEQQKPPENDEDHRRTQYTVRRRTSNSSLNKSISFEEDKPQDSSHKKLISNAILENDDGDDDNSDANTVNTEDTDVTIVNDNYLQDQVENLKLELAAARAKCEKAEREKNEMLMRRVASLDNSMSTKTSSSELFKLQQKVSELKATCDALQEEKRSLNNRVRDLENGAGGAAFKEVETLKSKLQAAESLCEELMDENQEVKRELRDMEEEIDEMQDNFRENQADEYTTLKKELEQTGKNCRILSFKLRKSERKSEQLEAEKMEAERQSREAIEKLEKEMEEMSDKLNTVTNGGKFKKKNPMLGDIPKSFSGEKVSRASLTRGGSQEDPAQLLRDLQDSMEREADVREQLRYAEEEAESLRKKVTRVEDDNESLLIQLKKMATKARSRRSSPTPHLELPADRDEGISEEDDPAELRILLELNEQETAVLRKKVQDLEENCDVLKKKGTELQEKLLGKEKKMPKSAAEKDSKETRLKLAEKQKECDKLTAELANFKKNDKTKARTEDLDLKRQMKMVEEEANVLKAKITALETENEKLTAENKKMSLTKGISKKSSEKQISEARKLLEAEVGNLSDALKLLKDGDLKGSLEQYEKSGNKCDAPVDWKNMAENFRKSICEILSISCKTAEGNEDLKRKLEEGAKTSKDGKLKFESVMAEKKKFEKDLKEKEKKILEGVKKETAFSKEIKSLQTKLGETNDQLASVYRELEEKNVLVDTLRKHLEISAKNCSKEDSKFKTELADKNKKLAELEKKLSSTEDKLKKADRALAAKNDRLVCVEKELETYKKESISLKAIGEMSEEREYKKKITELEMEIQKLTQECEGKEITRQMLDKSSFDPGADTSKNYSITDDKKISDLTMEYESKIHSLSEEIKRKEAEYAAITKKYEEMEIELFKVKNMYNLHKEQMNSRLACSERDLKLVQLELKTLRETFSTRQDAWMREKLRLEEKLREAGDHISSAETSRLEYNKMRALHDLAAGQLEKMKKEHMVRMDQLEHAKRENEELQRKLDDYEKVVKVQRNMVAEASAVDNQMREMKNKLFNAEHSRKIEVAALKVRYENHVAAITNEMKGVQCQLERFKHERNTYKHLLENSAQKAVVGAHNTESKPYKSDVDDQEMVDLRNQVATLEQQISCMEDEMTETRVENSRLKTELVSEKSSWEVKASEMMSRINRLEEERLMLSGRTKMPGLKTRMELAWQKEREEQNRLLQETATLARDLRQTLFEVERERDKERLEAKRRLENIRKNMEEEQAESKKKFAEINCDLLDLRDAHAKLRTTNEKLRREKEKLERDRNHGSRQESGAFAQDEGKMAYVFDLVTELLRHSANVKNMEKPPLPNKKRGTLSRESSAEKRSMSPESSAACREEAANAHYNSILQRLFDASQQFQSQRRESVAMKRAQSSECDKGRVLENNRQLARKGSLYRKCVSLEQTVPNDQAIWRDEDTDGSFTSIDDSSMKYERRDNSFDSRLSDSSTRSEILPSALEKKKKGFFGKLKKLARSSRSLDKDMESFPTNNLTNRNSNPGSNSSVSSKVISDNDNDRKKDFKGRLSDMFSKKGDSRSNSLEKNNGLLSRTPCSRPTSPTRLKSDDYTSPASTPLPRKIKR